MTISACLPMCSRCGTTCPPKEGFKKCGACKGRSYCGKTCQLANWKVGGHKYKCGKQKPPDEVSARPSCLHHSWCVYAQRNPTLDACHLVSTGNVNSHPKQLVCTGMNTCMFVAIKTKTCLVGWHAASIDGMGGTRGRKMMAVFRALSEINKDNFVDGYIIPGEDREADSLNLKADCRSMREHPWVDPTESRRFIQGVLNEFDWSRKLKTLRPVSSYKDFVVLDMAHKTPFVFSDVAQFD
jgi:hypothetical protein